MASPTPNKGYTYPAHGGAVNSWDTPLNTNFDQIDLNVGGVYTFALSTVAGVVFGSTSATFSSTVSTITLPSANAQNLSYVFTGTKTQNISLVFPGAVGGLYNIWNKSTDAFVITPVTTVAGSSGVQVPSGVNMLVSADKTNVKQADNFVNSLIGTSGTKLTYADGANTYSGNSSFTGTVNHSGVETFTGTTTFSSNLSAVRVSGSVVATSATQATGTSSNTVVTPLVQEFHRSAAHAWAVVICSTVNGAQSVPNSYRVSGDSRTAQGQHTVTLSPTMSSTNYCIIAGLFSGSFQPSWNITAQSTNTFSIEFRNNAGSLSDPTKFYFSIFG